ncbi:DUF1657 domain-containing protein [Fictibacillus gelatini]|uniref:DUF1657 domain-containing protein n=1 Tax=Fictibacillus gelatini TaxID=225985 RepID=UPI0004258093|nr:DUF1657 domain-containing protein [Fictibacillus gelatini]
MTVASSVKQCLATLKGIEAGFSEFALKSQSNDAKRIFHDCMMETRGIIADLEKRIGQLELEEPQYKGF